MSTLLLIALMLGVGVYALSQTVDFFKGPISSWLILGAWYVAVFALIKYGRGWVRWAGVAAAVLGLWFAYNISVNSQRTSQT